MDENFIKGLLKPDPILIDKIMLEEKERENLNPAPSVLNKIDIEEYRKLSIEETIIEKILGRILDKKELAEKFIEIVPLYYDNAGIFWMWNLQDRYWKIIDELDVLSWIENAAEANVINSKERTEILNALKLVARRNKPKEVSKLTLQFGKEIIDLETGNRFPSTAKYFVTNPIPYKLGSNSNTEKFDKLFREWVREEDVAKLYEILAYCILPDYPIERIFCLHGSGSNGKSCFLKILLRFLGFNNVCSTSLDTILKSRFEIARLYKKLACLIGETNLTKIENTQIVKRLVSGKDLIGIEFKNKTPFDYINYAKLIIATNNIPPTDDKTDGFYRKWLIIDFPNKFEKEIDVLADLTDEDFENLAMKCVHVLDDLLKRRAFSNEGNIEHRKEQYESKSNPLDKFLKEFTTDEDVNADIAKWEFEKRFNEWLKEHRLRHLSDITISKLMKARGIRETKPYKQWYENDQAVNRQVRCWGGIKWK